MRWRGRRQSSNVEDRRGASGGGFGFPRSGGRMRVPVGRRGGGVSLGAVALIVVASWVFGFDPTILLTGGGPDAGPFPQSEAPAPRSAEEQRLADFVRVILADTEDTWAEIFRAEGGDYRDPTLVMFSDQVSSACGYASAASGPFYCPNDAKVYIDLGFYAELERKLNAPGDFAQAYVLAHEVGHHVQNLLGVLPEYERARHGLGEAEANALSVRLELQADCLAGIWANHAAKRQGFLETGDIEEGLNAATQIGDDTLQKRSRGYVVPESFNHGTSAQRVSWFRTGIEEGRLASCDTFKNSGF
jgi:predicted metalloprotease